MLNRFLCSRIIACSASILLLATVKSSAESVVASDAFVDSAGVNTHLSWGPLYTTNFPLVVSRIKQLGVRHVRAGLIQSSQYYSNLNLLHQNGISVLLLTGPSVSPNVVTAYPLNAPGAIEAIEGPNEYDGSGDKSWAAILQAYMPSLYQAEKASPNTAHLPVIGPSLVSSASFTTLGEQSGYIDFGNLHNYPGGNNPGTIGWGGYDSYGNRYGSIAWNLDLGIPVWGGKAAWATEYGYDNTPNGNDAVPESVSATYIPRALLEQFMHGIRRTYLFELISGSSNNDDGFALMHTDGSVKPAFTAVSNLLGLLSDQGGTHFVTAPIDITLTGATSNVHHLIVEKQDGTYLLLLWVEKPCYNVNTKALISVPPQAVTAVFPDAPAGFTLHQLNADGSMSVTTEPGVQSPTFTVSDKVLAVEFKAAGMYSVTTTVTPTNSGSVQMTVSQPAGSTQNSATLQAAAASGFAFTKYSGDVNSTDSTTTFPLNSDKTVSAHFSCTYVATPSWVSVPTESGSTSIKVTTGAGCSIPVRSLAPWVTVAIDSSHPNSVLVDYSVNQGGGRNGSISIGNLTIPVSQASSYVPVTVAPNLPHLHITMDGQSLAAPATLNWHPGSVHTLSFPEVNSSGSKIKDPVQVSFTSTVPNATLTLGKSELITLPATVTLNLSTVYRVLVGGTGGQ